jgi:ring-1,2-phenylacetyl-CoA epoxidase subunit PaaC
MSTSVETARAADLAPELQSSVRDLILVLADTKRLLGMRYAEWILGAPELEAGIACASMAQDEWGHARLLYSLLKDFGDDVDAIEHGREPAEYRNMQVLDRAPESWPELVVLNAFADAALSLQLEALTSSAYTPLRQRVQKILDEEQFHRAHGRAWILRLARAGGDAQRQVCDASRSCVPSLLQWFGPDAADSRRLRESSIADATGSEMRAQFIQRIAPLIAELQDPSVVPSVEQDWDEFDESRRRTPGSSPDAETIARIRGDKNRAFLMD